ncbi:hypothetical protein J3459_008151 [Metarhizium acridum]|nr:hypothetical protein J3459_008151 [Metarhizium acridum]
MKPWAPVRNWLPTGIQEEEKNQRACLFVVPQVKPSLSRDICTTPYSVGWKDFGPKRVETTANHVQLNQQFLTGQVRNQTFRCGVAFIFYQMGTIWEAVIGADRGTRQPRPYDYLRTALPCLFPNRRAF